MVWLFCLWTFVFMDIQDYNNFRGTQLLSHSMKLWEMVIERRLQKDVTISENQFGFIPGRSTTEAIYPLRKLMVCTEIERRTFICIH